MYANLTDLLTALVGQNDYISLVATLVGGVIIVLCFDLVRKMILHLI